MCSRSCSCSVPLESQRLRGEVYLIGLGCPCKSGQDRQRSGKVLPLRRKSQTLPPMSNITKARGGKLPVHILATMNALGNLSGDLPASWYMWKKFFLSTVKHLPNVLPIPWSLSFHFLPLLFLFSQFHSPRTPFLCGLHLKPTLCPFPQSLDVGSPSLASRLPWFLSDNCCVPSLLHRRHITLGFGWSRTYRNRYSVKGIWRGGGAKDSGDNICSIW